MLAPPVGHRARPQTSCHCRCFGILGTVSQLGAEGVVDDTVEGARPRSSNCRLCHTVPFEARGSGGTSPLLPVKWLIADEIAMVQRMLIIETLMPFSSGLSVTVVGLSLGLVNTTAGKFSIRAKA